MENFDFKNQNFDFFFTFKIKILTFFTFKIKILTFFTLKIKI